MCLLEFLYKRNINLFLGYPRSIDSKDLIRRQRLIYINKQSKVCVRWKETKIEWHGAPRRGAPV